MLIFPATCAAIGAHLLRFLLPPQRPIHGQLLNPLGYPDTKRNIGVNKSNRNTEKSTSCRHCLGACFNANRRWEALQRYKPISQS